MPHLSRRPIVARALIGDNYPETSIGYQDRRGFLFWTKVPKQSAIKLILRRLGGDARMIDLADMARPKVTP